MNKHQTQDPVWEPQYKGEKWISSKLPVQAKPWLESNKNAVRKRSSGVLKTKEAIEKLTAIHPWQWPKRDIIFLSDLHADAEALTNSLVSSCGVKKNQSKDIPLKLTETGKQSVFVFGGDFFDKGPSNLALLRGLNEFIGLGPKVRILAGNHDIRVLFGMKSVGLTDDPRNGHFFVRMGAKAVPFLREIRDEYLYDKHLLKQIPSEKKCKQLLYPQSIWWDKFPEYASWVMPQVTIEREMDKIQKKVDRFEFQCDKNGLTIREAYASALKWQALFLEQKGEFYWFFRRMRLAYKQGSFLFVHAGLDDRTATFIREQGIGELNRLFKAQLNHSPFEFYYGFLANTIRTKYRIVDMPLSLSGSMQAHESGIYAVVHGHRNLHHGQRISLRKNLLHFECDVTLDRVSRSKEGLDGIGGGSTLIKKDGKIVGISSDCDHVKVFQPDSF